MDEQAHQTPAPPVDNNLMWAILVTIFCFTPTGIYAIICASKVNGLVAMGKIDEARAMATKASKWGMISFLIGIVIPIIGVSIELLRHLTDK